MEVNVLDRVRDRATPVALPAHRGADRKIPDQAPARGAGSISGRRGPRSFCSPNNPLITPGDQIVTRAKEGRKVRFFCGGFGDHQERAPLAPRVSIACNTGGLPHWIAPAPDRVALAILCIFLPRSDRQC